MRGQNEFRKYRQIWLWGHSLAFAAIALVSLNAQSAMDPARGLASLEMTLPVKNDNPNDWDDEHPILRSVEKQSELEQEPVQASTEQVAPSEQPLEQSGQNASVEAQPAAQAPAITLPVVVSPVETAVVVDEINETTLAADGQDEIEISEEEMAEIPVGETRSQDVSRVMPDLSRPYRAKDREKFPLEHEVFKRDSFLERLYAERPYARDSGAIFDRTMRFEKEWDNPFKTENQADFQRQQDEYKNQFRGWQKGLVNEQAKDWVDDFDRDTGPMKAFANIRKFFGAKSDPFAKREKKERIKRRSDGSIDLADYSREKQESEETKAAARISLFSTDKRAEEESRPLRFRSKANIPRRNGEMNVENSIVDTGARLDTYGDERLEVKANRHFSKLGLTAGGFYGFSQKTVGINVGKQITNELSCEFRSLKSNRVDVVSERQFRMSFGVGF